MNPSNEPEIQEELQPEVVEEVTEQVVAEQEEQAVAEPSEKELKAEKEAQQVKKDKRNTLIYIIIAVVFVLVGVAAIIWNSGLIQKNATAVTVNGETYTAAEVNFHYVNAYQSFLSEYGDYLSYIGLDTTVSLKNQEYTEGYSWFDYFLDSALYQLTSVAALTDAAAAEGYVYSDSLEEQLTSTMEELELYAPMMGYADGDAYLVANYGSTMTTELYQSLLRLALQASEYSTTYQNSLVYDEAALNAAYEADSTMYDYVDYELVYINNPVATTDADGNTIEVTDEMTAAAYAEAESIAQAILDDYNAGASLSDVADSYDIATYSLSESAYYNEDLVSIWAYEDGRQSGDAEIITMDGSTAMYVVAFQSRYREEYNLVDVRHILVMPETGTLLEGEEGYEAELADLRAMALAEAEGIYDEYLAGDQTEDSFSAQAYLYSDDSGSSSTGGLYSNISQGEMVEAFDTWCFDSSRQVGDTDIVETEYGFHIMYFSAVGLPHWQALVTYDLITVDFNAWFTDICADYIPVTSDFGMGFVG